MEHKKTLAQILDSKIRMHYHSIKKFSEVSGIPYMTISSVLKRGVENTTVGTLTKICNALGMTVTDLYDAQIFDTLHTKINTMSLEEYSDNDLIDDLIDCKKIDIHKRRYTDEQLSEIAKSYRLFFSDAFDILYPQNLYELKDCRTQEDKKDGN